jgi:preprotein translocase subunit YajC
MNSIMSVAFYLAAAAEPAKDAGAGAQGGLQQMLLMFGIIFVIFYLLILRPQKREQKRQEEIRGAIKRGDRVVSIGGIHGVVAAVDTTNNTISVEVDKNVKIVFSKAAISTVVTREDAKGAEEPSKK